MSKVKDFSDANRHLEHYDGPLDVVVDIGANVGALSFLAAEKGAKRIMAFEAHPEPFIHMKNSISDEPIFAFDLAVCRKWESNRILYGPGNGSASILQKKSEVHEVETIAFLGVLGLRTPIDYLKIDIEGGEYEIFDKSSEVEKALRRVRFLDLEIHNACSPMPEPWPEKDYDTALREYVHSLGFEPNAYVHDCPNAVGAFNKNFEG